MKIKHIVLTLMFICILFISNAQTSDSINIKKNVRRVILPTTLIASGVLINNSQLEKDFKTNLRNKVGNNFEFRIDNYIQYAPISEMYLADLLDIKAKHYWFNQTKYLLISNIITSGITHGLKRLTRKTRPNGSYYSFPSGHTTFAFTNATVLFNEFYQTSPLLAYSGYAFAATTGAFRMINNKHWLSDVLVGAGIGIVVTNLVYYFEPLRNFNPFKKSKNISIIPQINDKNYGLYFSYNF